MSDTWKAEARIDQQEYFEQEGYRSWIFIDPGDQLGLRVRIGYKLFEPSLQQESDQNEHTGFSKQELQFIDEICKKLTKHFQFETDGIWVSCILILVHDQGITVKKPIFKAKAVKSESCIFVDTWSRTYVSWNDWLEYEKLPACTYCAPDGGVYEADADGKVKLTFGKSRACNVSNAMGVLETAFRAAQVGSQIIPRILPSTTNVFRLATAAASVFDLGRSSRELYDRATHGESIGVGDDVARRHWLTVLTGALGPVAEVTQNRLEASIRASTEAGKTVNPRLRVGATSTRYAGSLLRTLRAAHYIGDEYQHFRNKKSF